MKLLCCKWNRTNFLLLLSHTTIIIVTLSFFVTACSHYYHLSTQTTYATIKVDNKKERKNPSLWMNNETFSSFFLFSKFISSFFILYFLQQKTCSNIFLSYSPFLHNASCPAPEESGVGKTCYYTTALAFPKKRRNIVKGTV